MQSFIIFPKIPKNQAHLHPLFHKNLHKNDNNNPEPNTIIQKNPHITEDIPKEQTNIFQQSYIG